MTLEECPCGSGEWPNPVHDARGIFVSYVCHKCEKEKLSGYRPEIFTNPGYWTDETVEPEEELA